MDSEILHILTFDHRGSSCLCLFSVACVASFRKLMFRVRNKARCDLVLALGVRKHFQMLGTSIHRIFHRDIDKSTSRYSENPCDDATLLPVSEPRWWFGKLGKPGKQRHLPFSYCQGNLRGACRLSPHVQTPQIPQSPKVCQARRTQSQARRSPIQLGKIPVHERTPWDLSRMILASEAQLETDLPDLSIIFLTFVGLHGC